MHETRVTECALSYYDCNYTCSTSSRPPEPQLGCWKTSTYRFRTLRFACALALAPGGGGPSKPGGPSIEEVEEGGGLAVAGLAGTDCDSDGTKLDRTRIGGLGGESVRSMAVAGRTGGVRAIGGPVGSLAVAVPGDAVCARDGGGGGAAGFSSAAPA